MKATSRSARRAHAAGTERRPAPTPPPSPAGWSLRLHDAARALGLELPPEATDRLLHYLALLQRWGRVHNLSAIDDAEHMLVQHVFDSLAIVPLLRRHRPQGRGRLLDVGSGGGLPGVVVAIALPDWQVTCVDAVGKKAGFVRQVAIECAVPNLLAVHARVEDLARSADYRQRQPDGADVITSRAFASLRDFVRLSRACLAPAGVWLAMKGRRPDDELAALAADPGHPPVDVFHVEPLRVPELPAQRCAVWIRLRSNGPPATAAPGTQAAEPTGPAPTHLSE